MINEKGKECIFKTVSELFKRSSIIIIFVCAYAQVCALTPARALICKSLGRSEEGAGSLGAGVKDDCELPAPCGCWKLKRSKCSWALSSLQPLNAKAVSIYIYMTLCITCTLHL